MPRTPEELAAYKATTAELRKWRLAASMTKAKELRSKYEAGGVDIGIVKFDGIADLAEDELDYAFTLAKTLGARAVSLLAGGLIAPMVGVTTCTAASSKDR